MTFLWATVIPPKGMACDRRREYRPAGQDSVGAGAFIETSREGLSCQGRRWHGNFSSKRSQKSMAVTLGRAIFATRGAGAGILTHHGSLCVLKRLRQGLRAGRVSRKHSSNYSNVACSGGYVIRIPSTWANDVSLCIL